MSHKAKQLLLTAPNSCYKCNNPYTTDQIVLTPHDDYPVLCSNCYNNEFATCDFCNNLYENNDVTQFRGNVYCNDCQTDRLVACGNCHDWEEEGRARYSSGDPICRNCQDDYGYCASCSEYVPTEDLYMCSNCDEDYCEDCQHSENCGEEEDEDRDSGVLQFFDGKPCKLVDNDRYMGVEIEAEKTRSYNTLHLPKKFVITGDGSLRNGIEVKTPPSSGTEHLANIKEACKGLKDSGFKIESTCGLHVHIDMRDKQNDFKYLAHLITTFYAIEDILYAMQPKSRQFNNYCKWLRSDFKFFDFYGKEYIDDFDYRYYKIDKKKYGSKSEIANSKKSHYQSSRYYGINFHSVFFRGSMEVRIHAGSINPIKIARWSNIVQKIVKWVDTSYNYKTVLKLLSQDVTEEKIKMFCKTFDLDKELSWHVKTRITQFNNLGLKQKFDYGTIPPAYKKKITFEPLGKVVMVGA